MSIANTSQHLQQLRKAHLVRVRRQGLYMFYSLAGEEAFGAWKGIRDFGQSEVAEVDRLVQSFLSDRAKLEPMTAADLLARIEKDDVTVLDVRPAVEYEAGHIKGARSIPVDEIEGHLKSLRRSREVIAYCRGPYCVYADQAVQTLTRRGYRARRLEIGFPDWRAAGLPVSASGEVDRRKRKVST
jgi:rhodanese-related sulfurtransferase